MPLKGSFSLVARDRTAVLVKSQKPVGLNERGSPTGDWVENPARQLELGNDAKPRKRMGVQHDKMGMYVVGRVDFVTVRTPYPLQKPSVVRVALRATDRSERGPGSMMTRSWI